MADLSGKSRLVTDSEPCNVFGDIPDLGRCDLCGSEAGTRDIVRTPSGWVWLCEVCDG